MQKIIETTPLCSQLRRDDGRADLDADAIVERQSTKTPVTAVWKETNGDRCSFTLALTVAVNDRVDEKVDVPVDMRGHDGRYSRGGP